MDDKGQTLVTARIVDDSSSTYLPLKAVDAPPALPIIRELEKDWRQILDGRADPGSVSSQPDNGNLSSAVPPTTEHCLVYFSTSLGLFQEEDIASILQQSRRNNAVAGITGLLLYINGNIIQVLEGEKGTIEALYKRIAQDQRHTHVVCVLNRPITQRLFARRSMAYETLTESQLDEIEAIVASSKREDSVATNDSIVLKTLRAFYGTNHQ